MWKCYPASYLKDEEGVKTAPSFWSFPEITSWLDQGGLRLIHFDQGSMGHARRKPTTILSNLPELHQLHGLRGDGRDSGPLPASVFVDAGGAGGVHTTNGQTGHGRLEASRAPRAHPI